MFETPKLNHTESVYLVPFPYAQLGLNLRRALYFRSRLEVGQCGYHHPKVGKR